MGNIKSTAARRRALWLAAGPILAACTTQAPPPAAEPTGQTSSAVFANGGFEADADNTAPSSWIVTTYENHGVTIQSPQTRAGLGLTSGVGTARTVTLATTAPETQIDPNLGATATLRWPKFGKNVAVVNRLGKDYNVNSMKQTMTVAAADIDAVDQLAHIRFVLAPVLQDPDHSREEQPYFFVQLTNLTKGNQILYQDFNFANQPGVPWKDIGTGGDTIRYTDWSLVDIAPGSAKLAPGDQVELEIIAAGCSRNGHWGYVYVDGVGSTVPGLFVTATGPASANDDSDITYTLRYKNDGTTGAAGVVVEFNTPPNTTFTSFTAPGLSCTAPTAGTPGKVSCTVGALAAGASGSFQIKAHILPGVAAGSFITAGNYDIRGTGISPLLGPKVYTEVTHGVTYANLGIAIQPGAPSVPAGSPVTYVVEVTNTGPSAVSGATITDNLPPQLTGGTWTCVGTGGATCTANGTGNINDSATSIPVGGKLTYTVTATVAPGTPAGQLANVASVSPPAGARDPDPSNNSVGNYKQITVANGIDCTGNVQCTSGVCHAPDHKCGLPITQGPCTGANGPVVCRDGACSVNNTCMPTGGCNVDADCTGGNWCNQSTHVCTAKLPNGTSMPNDPPHTSPVLDGQCSVPAATLTCVSGVCDVTDDQCGYPNGVGPCNAANAPVVCRSGACSANNTCMPSTGCNVDGDCAAGKWCHMNTHACLDRVDNGGNVPTDPGHTTPVLNGDCTEPAASLTCVSRVCDTSDDKCGYADGTGPCTAGNAATVCRSRECSTDGTCKPVGGCNADSDCTGGKWCKVSTHTCTEKVPNGTAVPNDPGHKNPTLDGDCTTASGTLTCASAVCDTSDDKCGYADGRGPCTAANGGTVCRSGSCSTTGVCKAKTGCNVDADCNRDTQYCDTGKHECTAKLQNGTPIPTVPGHTPALNADCNEAVAQSVCMSGVCDPSDDKCGYPNGGGPCTVESASKVCRSGACDSKDGKCGLQNGSGPCASDLVCRSNDCDEDKRVCGSGCKADSECASTEFCRADGACSPKLPDGDICQGSNQCQSAACNDQVCDSLFAAGSGLSCAVLPGESGHEGTGVATFGMALVVAGLTRRRRQRGVSSSNVPR